MPAYRIFCHTCEDCPSGALVRNRTEELQAAARCTSQDVRWRTDRRLPGRYAAQMAKVLQDLIFGLSLFHRQRREARADASDEVRRRVLIVVEDRVAGKNLARLLMAMGYERVRIVRRAARALLIAQRFSPGIVFLDIALLDDAYELASDLRRQVGGSLRLIALTNSIEHSTREQARDAGFERWLVTPVTKSELDSLMRRADSDTG